MKIVITEFMDESAVARLDTHFGAAAIHYAPDLVDQPERLAALAADADALIVRNRTQVRGALLAAAQGLRVVGRLGVGLDNIDVPECERRGIRVIPATGANALAVAEYVITAILMLRRASFQSSREVAQGGWPRNRLSAGHEIAGATLGLVGFGSIGQLTGGLARTLGMRVIAHDPGLPADHPAWREIAARVELDRLIADADAVSLHVPLIDATRNLFDAARLSAMKPGAILVNTARGGIVDELALAEALRRGHLGGAALDVFATEPLPAAAHFEDCPNLILTPHIAGVSAEANVRVSSMIAEAVIDALGGPTR